MHSFLLIGQKALQNVTQRNLIPNVGFVSAKGLGANPDNLHFNAKSLHEFGLRYFEVYKQVAGEVLSAMELL